jgi:hypothetical protein
VIAALCCMGYSATPSGTWSAVCSGVCGVVETGVIVQHDHTACEHAGMLSHDGGTKV